MCDEKTYRVRAFDVVDGVELPHTDENSNPVPGDTEGICKGFVILQFFTSPDHPGQTGCHATIHGVNLLDIAGAIAQHPTLMQAADLASVLKSLNSLDSLKEVTNNV